MHYVALSKNCHHWPWHFFRLHLALGSCYFLDSATVHSVMPGVIWGRVTAVTPTSGPEKTVDSFALCPRNNTAGFKKGVKLLCPSLRNQGTQWEVREKATCVLKGCQSEITTRAAQWRYGVNCRAIPAEHEGRGGEQRDIGQPLDLLSGQRSGCWAYNTQSSLSQAAEHKKKTLKRTETVFLHDTHLIYFFLRDRGTGAARKTRGKLLCIETKLYYFYRHLWKDFPLFIFWTSMGPNLKFRILKTLTTS